MGWKLTEEEIEAFEDVTDILSSPSSLPKSLNACVTPGRLLSIDLIPLSFPGIRISTPIATREPFAVPSDT